MKRALDIFLSAFLLLLLLPLFILIGIVIRFDNAGPVFFKQQRMGQGLVPFTLYKFRSMADVKGVPDLQVTSAGDKRITRVGAVLRKLKLDELPQLWNVLIGDMSLVGPRPEVPKYANSFPDLFRDVCAVRPGLTGPSQLQFFEEEEVLAAADDPEVAYVESILPAKLNVDLDYVQNHTFLKDLRILVLTVLRILHLSAKS